MPNNKHNENSGNHWLLEETGESTSVHYNKKSTESSIINFELVNNLSELLEKIKLSENDQESEETLQQLGSMIKDLEEVCKSFKKSFKQAKKAHNFKFQSLIRKNSPKYVKVMSYVVRFLLMFVTILQIINVTYLTISDSYLKIHGEQNEGQAKILDTAVMAITQFMSLALVISSTVYLSKSLMNKQLTGVQLAQHYLSTILVFSGVYLMIYRNKPSSIDIQGKADDIPVNPAIIQYIKMLYLSVSSATLCGAADVQPVSWFVTLLVCVQNIINFVYFASILAQTIGQSNTHIYKVQYNRNILEGTSKYNLADSQNYIDSKEF